MRNRVHVDEDASGVLNDLQDGLRQRLGQASVMVQTEMRRTLSGQRTGRWYRVPKLKHKRLYRASRAGEAPASRFGDLKKAIDRHVDPRRLVATIGAVNAVGHMGNPGEYGAILELGKLKRKFVEPTFERVAPKIRKILTEGWR